MTSIVVNGTTHYLRDAEDAYGKYHIVDGMTTVLNASIPLQVKYEKNQTIVHPDLYMVKDSLGNNTINIPLSEHVMLIISGIFEIDESFIEIMRHTPLYSIVHDKKGCIAVSEFQIRYNRYLLEAENEASVLRTEQQ